MATTWTVVYRTSKFANAFRPTGFEGTWEESSEHARTVAQGLPETAEVWNVASHDTAVLVDSGRWVRILPTEATKAAAKARLEKVDAIVARHEARLAEPLGYSPVLGFGARLYGHVEDPRDPRQVAAYAVDNGMDWDAIARTQW